MKILLLGGGGFLGMNLSHTLLLEGHEVHLLDSAFSNQSLREKISAFKSVIHVINAIDFEQVLDTVDKYKIECVINLVSQLIPSSSHEDFANENIRNSKSAFGILNGLADRSVNYVYMSSGGTVYGASKKYLVDECENRAPINYYGLSKLLFEEQILFYNRKKGLKYQIIRPSNPYGPMQNPQKKQGLVAVVVDKIKRGDEIQIWGDGTVVRDYVWVGDFANAVSKLIAQNKWNEIYNVGSGRGYSINQVIDAAQLALGVDAKVSYTNPRPEDVDRIVLDIKKIQSTISYQPLNLKQGLDLYIQHLYAMRA